MNDTPKKVLSEHHFAALLLDFGYDPDTVGGVAKSVAISPNSVRMYQLNNLAVRQHDVSRQHHANATALEKLRAHLATLEETSNA